MLTSLARELAQPCKTGRSLFPQVNQPVRVGGTRTDPSSRSNDPTLTRLVIKGQKQRKEKTGRRKRKPPFLIGRSYLSDANAAAPRPISTAQTSVSPAFSSRWPRMRSWPCRTPGPPPPPPPCEPEQGRQPPPSAWNPATWERR